MVCVVAGAWLLAGCHRNKLQSSDDTARIQAAAKKYAHEQFMWRGRRVIALTREGGWTSLIGLHWLDAGTHRVGSGADNGLRLAMGPKHLGVPSGGGALRSDQDPAGASVIGFDDGKGEVTVIERNGRLALRVKHADAASRVQFAGLQYWVGGQDWQVPAHFIAHPAGKTLPIANIIGGTDQIPNPGVVEFVRGDKTYRLEALDEGEGTLFLVFADRTSGHGSYGAGRFIDAPKPDAKGRLVIDFNQAYNPPCAFTPFATCPLPPPENRLDLRVEAGEKAYIKPAPPAKDAP